MPGSAPPFVSRTVAVTVDVPPLGLTLAGFALTVTLVAAAAPIVIFTLLVAVVVPPVPPDDPPVAPPDTAVTVATPEPPPALNVATARPLVVCTSAGDTVPIVDVKRTVVPFCTGVPLDSVTN